MVVDSAYYGQLTVTAYTFLKVNLMDGIAENYGTHPWHWYVTVGAAVPLFTYVPFVVVGVWVVARKHRAVAGVVLPMVGGSLAVLSMSPHKEYRFLLPIMPALVLLTAYAFEGIPLRRGRAMLVMAIALQVPVAVYTSQWHQSAPLATVDYLRNEGAKSVDFWLDCHLTPFHSHFHKSNTELHFLDCSPLYPPPSSPETEVSRFFQHPETESLQRLAAYAPEFVVLWSPIAHQAAPALLSQNYTLVQSFFHAHITESPVGDQYNVSFLVYRKKGRI